jgi:hypothetical protein
MLDQDSTDFAEEYGDDEGLLDALLFHAEKQSHRRLQEAADQEKVEVNSAVTL